MHINSRTFFSLLSRFTRKYISYYADKWYQISPDGLEPVGGSPAFSAVLILARQHYTEETVWYPIARRGDVKKLVANNAAVQSKQAIFQVGKAVNGKTPVTYFKLTSDQLTYKAWFVVPESLWIGRKLNIGEIAAYQSLGFDKTVFIARTFAGVVSSFKSGLLALPEHFALAHGLNSETNVKKIALKSELISSRPLLAGIQWFELWMNIGGNQHSDSKKLMKWVTGLAVTIFLSLFGSVRLSAYLLEVKQHELQEATRQANAILAERDKVQQLKQRYESLSATISARPNAMMLWQQLATLYQHNIWLTALDQRGEDIRIEIRAKSATEALQLLLKQPAVASAEFDAPVRRTGTEDEASIVIRLKGNRKA